MRELADGDPGGLASRVRRLVLDMAGRPFGPLQVTMYRFPDGRHEVHLDVGPDGIQRFAGAGRDPLEAAAALLAAVEREMAARRLERWRARGSA